MGVKNLSTYNVYTTLTITISIFQDNKPCDFDKADCAKSNLCIDFKATLTCEESIEHGPFYPQCDIDSNQFC